MDGPSFPQWLEVFHQHRRERVLPGNAGNGLDLFASKGARCKPMRFRVAGIDRFIDAIFGNEHQKIARGVDDGLMPVP